MFWFSLILALLIMNMIIGIIHIKIFTNEFRLYRKQSKTLVGQQKNIFKGLSVAMFQVDNEGVILKAKYFLGFALFPDFENWTFPVGKKITELDCYSKEIDLEDRRLSGAVKNAENNWNLYKKSQEI